MARWHVEEEKKNSERRAARMRGRTEPKGGGGGGSRETAVVEKSKKETADRVARHHQADQQVEPVYVTSSCCDYLVFGMRVLAEQVFPFFISSLFSLSSSLYLFVCFFFGFPFLFQ